MDKNGKGYWEMKEEEYWEGRWRIEEGKKKERREEYRSEGKGKESIV